MANETNIEWCDSTFNPWIGCTRVSPACDDCYAVRSTPARTLGVVWGPGEPRHRTSGANWKQPRRWQADSWTWKAAMGRRQRVFCASLADWLDNEVPIQWLVDLLQLVHDTPDLDWLLLSKRVGNWSSRISEAIGFLDEQTPAAYPLPLRAWLAHWLDGDAAPRNVWLGITVVNQAEADRDIPKLLRVPAAVRFLSIEPMLGPIHLDEFHPTRDPAQQKLLDGIDWLICGGESGSKARPMHPDWARSLRDQCAAAGVPFLWKQWGEWVEADRDGDMVTATEASGIEVEEGRRYDLTTAHGAEFIRVGKKAAGRQLDGRTHDGFPEVRRG